MRLTIDRSPYSWRWIRTLYRNLYLTSHSDMYLLNTSPFVNHYLFRTITLWFVHGTWQCGLIGPILQLWPKHPKAKVLLLMMELFSPELLSAHPLKNLWVYFCDMYLLGYLPSVFGNYSPHPQGWISWSHIWSQLIESRSDASYKVSQSDWHSGKLGISIDGDRDLDTYKQSHINGIMKEKPMGFGF